MKKIVFGIAILSLMHAASCKKDKNTTTTPVVTTTTEDSLGYELSADITTNRTLKAGKTYVMTSLLYVKNGATLTIEKGVTIRVWKGKVALVVTRGSKLIAEGTATEPIVLTSFEAAPAPGDWGGIVLLGKATVNSAFNGTAGQGEIEGGVNNSAGDGLYGGTDDNDNSGIIKYVRIEYAGYPFQPDKELNSLTMGGVGRGTEIDYVQCSYGGDDAFEWFGGTVNAKHLIAYMGLDDDFDTDNGFRGTVQFGIAVRNKDKADISGSNGFESDNDASGTTTTPITAPVFANITIIGPKADAGTTIATNFKRGAHIRRNSNCSIYNSVIMGYPTGILIDGSKSGANLVAGTLELKGIVLAGDTKATDTVGTTTVVGLGGLGTFITANTTWNNEVKTNTADAGLVAAYATGASFDPSISAGSVLAGGVVTSSKLSGAATVSYRGAVGVGDTWWKGWTKFN